MSLPEWANEIFEQFKPGPAYGDETPNEARLAAWSSTQNRFALRWRDIAPDLWKPLSEGRGGAEYSVPRGGSYDDQYLRRCILECALEAALEKTTNKPPGAVVDAMIELDRLNAQICDAAGLLATLFRQRDSLQENYRIADHAPEYWQSDPFNLWEALEQSMESRKFRAFAFVSQKEAGAFFRLARTQSRPGPQWPDILGAVADRAPRRASSLDSGDAALSRGRTNKSEWSPWVRRLIGMLDNWGGLPDGMLLGCLSNPQLATLAEVAFDAPPGAFNADQIRVLKGRYQKQRGL